MTPFPSTLYHFADTVFSQASSSPGYKKLKVQKHRSSLGRWEDVTEKYHEFLPEPRVFEGRREERYDGNPAYSKSHL